MLPNLALHFGPLALQSFIQNESEQPVGDQAEAEDAVSPQLSIIALKTDKNLIDTQHRDHTEGA